MNCSKCGNLNNENARFCVKCGNVLGTPVPNTSQNINNETNSFANQSQNFNKMEKEYKGNRLSGSVFNFKIIY